MRLSDICLETLSTLVHDRRLDDVLVTLVEQLQEYVGADQAAFVQVSGSVPEVRLQDHTSPGPLDLTRLASCLTSLECAGLYATDLEPRVVAVTQTSEFPELTGLLGSHGLRRALILPFHVDAQSTFALVVVGGIVSLEEEHDWPYVLTIARAVAGAIRQRSLVSQHPQLQRADAAGHWHELRSAVADVSRYARLLQTSSTLPRQHVEWSLQVGKHADRVAALVDSLLPAAAREPAPRAPAPPLDLRRSHH